MDSYIVYIFRRPGQSGNDPVGLVERIGKGERKAFQTEPQLIEYVSKDIARHSQDPALYNAPKKR